MKKDTNETKKSKVKVTKVNDIYSVCRVNNYSDDCTFFTLIVNVNDDLCVTIDGCRVITTKEEENFISFPSKKSDDKYYNIVYVNIDPEDKEAIIDKVASLI